MYAFEREKRRGESEGGELEEEMGRDCVREYVGHFGI